MLLAHEFVRVQLETVFVVEGLGPPMDDEQRQALGGKSFEDQVGPPGTKALIIVKRSIQWTPALPVAPHCSCCCI
jgi:hypothetical protein